MSGLFIYKLWKHPTYSSALSLPWSKEKSSSSHLTYKSQKNIPSPVLMTNLRGHNIVMASLTPNSGFVVPDKIPPLPSLHTVGVGEWEMTENRPLPLSFRLNPWPYSRGLTHSQVWLASTDHRKWLAGSRPITSWTGLLHLFLLYPLHPSVLPFYLGQGFERGYSPHQSVMSSLFRCHWQTSKYDYNDILIKLVLDSASIGDCVEH